MSDVVTDQFDILKEVILPGYASKEGIQEYTREKLKEIGIESLMANEEVRAIMDGKQPITEEFLSKIHYLLDVGVDTLIPFNPNLPEEKYFEVFRKINNGEPNYNDAKGPLVNLLISSYGDQAPTVTELE